MAKPLFKIGAVYDNGLTALAARAFGRILTVRAILDARFVLAPRPM